LHLCLFCQEFFFENLQYIKPHLTFLYGHVVGSFCAYSILLPASLQSLDNVHRVLGRVSVLYKIKWWDAGVVICVEQVTNEGFCA